MTILDEMREIPDRHDKIAVMKVLSKYVHIDEVCGTMIIVTGFIGDDVEDVVSNIAVWFYAQLAFSKLIFTRINGIMTVTFDLEKYSSDSTVDMRRDNTFFGKPE